MKIDYSTSLKIIANQYIDNTEDMKTEYLHLGSIKFQVFSNSSSLLQSLREYFFSFPKETVLEMIDMYVIDCENIPEIEGLNVKKPDIGKNKIKELFVNTFDGRCIRKKITGLTFLIGDDFNIAIGECLENNNQIINFINNRIIEILLNRDMVLGHAAGVAMGKKGICIAGFSGMGKSTLALHLMNFGMHFISNDRVILNREGDQTIMYGVPKMPRINPGTIINNKHISKLFSTEKMKNYQNLSTDELWGLEEKYDLPVDEFYGKDSIQLQSSANLLVLLNWGKTNEATRITEIDIIENQDLLQALIKEEGLFYRPSQNRTRKNLCVDDYLDVLKYCKTVTIQGRIDFPFACQEILKRL